VIAASRKAALISKGDREAITSSIPGNGRSTPTPMPTKRLNNLLATYDRILIIIMTFASILRIGAIHATRRRSFAISNTKKPRATLRRRLS